MVPSLKQKPLVGVLLLLSTLSWQSSCTAPAFVWTASSSPLRAKGTATRWTASSRTRAHKNHFAVKYGETERSGSARKRARPSSSINICSFMRSSQICWSTRASSQLGMSATGTEETATGTTTADDAKLLEELVSSGNFVDLSGGRNTCLKRIDYPGDKSEGNPPKGSKVKVHYKMRVLGGEEISTSGEEEGKKPFQFRLGRWPSEATQGWDKAVSSMLKGETVTLVCGPQYAFGEKGAPPKIPPNATVETKLELVEWLDLAVAYNNVPGKLETEDELMERWKEDLENNVSPMREEAGIGRKVGQQVSKTSASFNGERDHRNNKVYDIKTEEARKILANQKVQGYTAEFGYVERAKYFDLYIPVPKGTRAKDVTCDIHPDSMCLEVKGVGVVTQGQFDGKVALDGSFWVMSDLSLDTPSSTGSANDEIRQGPRNHGKTCVQVYLEKMKPFDTLWEDVYRCNSGEEGVVIDAE